VILKPIRIERPLARNFVIAVHPAQGVVVNLRNRSGILI
jgi:hypothetical protein